MSHDPAAHEDGLSILDPRFPMDVSGAEPAPIYSRLIRDWERISPVFAGAEAERAGWMDVMTPPVRRFVQPLPLTQPIPAITAPYPDLTPASLDRDDETTATVTAVYTFSDVPSPTGRKRGADGRFLPEAV